MYTPLRKSAAHPSYYVVTLAKMRVGGRDLSDRAGTQLKSHFARGYGTVLDSGARAAPILPRRRALDSSAPRIRGSHSSRVKGSVRQRQGRAAKRTAEGSRA